MAASSTTPVYTVCDESRYLIVKNVPALGCTDDLVKLFSLHGPIEEYRIMDEEECEPFTDIYWIKFVKISNARFAKRKLDDHNFFGNLLQVTYAPSYETPLDTKDKLEERRSVVLNRITSEKREQTTQRQIRQPDHVWQPLPQYSQSLQTHRVAQGDCVQPVPTSKQAVEIPTLPSSGAPNHQHFSSVSMNATVQAVRQKLYQISSVGVESRDVPLKSWNSPRGNQFDAKQHEIQSQLEKTDGKQFDVKQHEKPSQSERKPDVKKPRIDNRPRI